MDNARSSGSFGRNAPVRKTVCWDGRWYRRRLRSARLSTRLGTIKGTVGTGALSKVVIVSTCGRSLWLSGKGVLPLPLIAAGGVDGMLNAATLS